MACSERIAAPLVALLLISLLVSCVNASDAQSHPLYAGPRATS